MKEEYKQIIEELEKETSQEVQNQEETSKEEEMKQDDVSNEANQEEKEEEKEEEENVENEEIEEKIEKPQRKPREPKLIEAWRAEVEKKKLLKKAEEEKQELLNQLNQLKEEFENFKRSHTKSQITEEEQNVELKIKELSQKYNIDESFLRDIYSTLKPKVLLPKELIEKISEIDRIKEENRIKQEDLIFEGEFNRYIVPKLREKYSDLTENEIEKVKEVVKNDYFSEKYITLEIDELFKLNSDKYEKYLSPRKYSVEDKNAKNVSRESFTKIDYNSLTEEDFAKMSEEEREKVIKFLSGGRI